MDQSDKISRGLLDRFRSMNARLNERFFKPERDPYRDYLSWIEKRLPPAGILVDLGAGQVSLRRYLPRISGQEGSVIALDASRGSLLENGTRLKVAAKAQQMPFQNEALDVIAASCFFEHLENPDGVLSESYRVLKKGGALIFYTPHRSSYVATIARAIPSASFHHWIRTLQTGNGSPRYEVCRTFYRMNTVSDWERRKGAFRILHLETSIGAPCYTTFLPPPIHLIFILFHKVVQRSSWLRRAVGESLVGCLVKPALGYDRGLEEVRA
jgi:SAM-dependent methyltransferase